MISNHSIDVEAERRLFGEWLALAWEQFDNDATQSTDEPTMWAAWLAAKRSIAQPAADPAPVPAQTGVDAVERIIEVIKAAPAHIAARADMSPKGNMIGEFPAQGIDHAKLADELTFTVDGVVMSPMEYIDYLHGQLAGQQAGGAGGNTKGDGE